MSPKTSSYQGVSLRVVLNDWIDAKGSDHAKITNKTLGAMLASFDRLLERSGDRFNAATTTTRSGSGKQFVLACGDIEVELSTRPFSWMRNCF